MNNKVKAKEIKSSINLTLESLGKSRKWLEIAGLVFAVFKGEKYPENDANSLDRLANVIRKNLVEEDRNQVEFLSKLDNALKTNDYTYNLCEKYLGEFRNKKYFIPENDLKRLREKANDGNKLAQRVIGDHYRYGGNFGVPNITEAHRYYSMAFEGGCHISSLHLANIYSNREYYMFNKDIALRYYSYSLLFYFEGDNYFNYVNLDDKDFIITYLNKQKESILSQLETLSNRIINYNMEKHYEKQGIDALLEHPLVKEFLSEYYLVDKIRNVYSTNSEIRTIFGKLGNLYERNDEAFFLLSLCGSILGDAQSLWYLGYCFRAGKGVGKDITLSGVCYILLLLINNDVDLELKIMEVLSLIRQELKQEKNDDIQEQLLSALEQILPYKNSRSISLQR